MVPQGVSKTEGVARAPSAVTGQEVSAPGSAAVPGAVLELIVNEAGEPRREHEGMMADRQVGMPVVVVNVIVGESDDAGQGEGVEADESSRDADLQGQRRVIEAAQQFFSVFLRGLEAAWESGGRVLDDQMGRAEASCSAPAKEGDGT